MNASLAPGSILLHMTKGEISKLIAWADNGQYSHAAIVLDDDKIAEAVAAGVREFPLADRLAQADEFRWIDAYAPAQPLGAADLEAVRTVAKGYVGVPYPLNELMLLGLVCAARDKIPEHEWARWIVREAFDLALAADPKSQVCSEFVFRCFAEAKTSPARRLAPRIVVEPRREVPFPDINWGALWKEYEDARQRAHGPPTRPRTPLRPAVAATRPVEGDRVDLDELRAKAAQVRARRGVGAIAAATAAAGPIEDPRPNPKLVTPADLAASPSFSVAARVVSSG
jgi:hypothetical protein